MTSYTLYPPTIPSGAEKFYFTSTVQNDSWKFDFEWRTDHWVCKVTLPDASLREAGVYPGVENWKGYADYSITFNLTGAEIIGITDAGSVLITLIYK